MWPNLLDFVVTLQEAKRLEDFLVADEDGAGRRAHAFADGLPPEDCPPGGGNVGQQEGQFDEDLLQEVAGGEESVDLGARGLT